LWYMGILSQIFGLTWFAVGLPSPAPF